MDSNFFESPVVQSVLTGTDYPASTNYRQGPSLEATWAKVDLYYKLCNRGVISEEETFKLLQSSMRRSRVPGYVAKMDMDREERHLCVPSMAGWELLALVSAVFRDLKCDKHKQSPLFRLIDELRAKKLLNGIVTFNYDTSVEHIFRHNFHNSFYYPCLRHLDTTTKLPLMKLHGSLNWQFDKKSDPPIRVMNPITTVAKMDHHSDGWYRQPEVIGPTFFKQEITFDIEVKDDPRAPYYQNLWEFSWKKLKHSRDLIFVGFSFPQTDFHAEALFRSAHLSGNGFRRIILCHLNDTNLRATAEQVFSGKGAIFTEFDKGLENMAVRLDELLELLQN